MRNEFYTMRTPSHERGLKDMISWINNIRPTSEMNMIEIGSYVGESTLIFAENFKEIISVDPYVNDYDLTDAACFYAPFDEVYNQFLKNTSEIKNIKSIKQTSKDALSLLQNQKWDLVYIDGLHTFEGVFFDIGNYKSIINQNGFLCGHDYSCGNVRQAIVQLLDDKVDKVFEDDSWIKKL